MSVVFSFIKMIPPWVLFFKTSWTFHSEQQRLHVEIQICMPKAKR